MFKFLETTRSGTLAWFTAIVMTFVLAVPFTTFVGMLCLDHYSDTESEEDWNRHQDFDAESTTEAPTTPPPTAPATPTPEATPTNSPEPESPDAASPPVTRAENAKERRKDPYSGTDQTDGPWYRSAESRQYRMFTRFAALSAVAAFGALGAAVSMALRYRQSSAAPLVPTPIDVISTQLLGASFALLLCLLFIGQFIRGTLFPDPHDKELNQWFAVMYSLEEFAKLLVWSFIAGFSERLVPDFIRSLSERFTRETQFKDDTKNG